MERKEPEWHEWNLPELRVPCIQANANVVVVEKSEDTTFDYWLRISTLDKGNPLRVPVKLASYHKQALEGRTLNSSTTLHKRNGVWWLTLSCDEDVPLQTATSAPCVGVDVGIVNFLTTSTGKQYGTFHGKLARRQKRDREKRRRKAKLRACLKKKGVENLPSTSSATGQRLSRHVRQEINRAVNLLLEEHPDARIIYEDLSVASMRFKARAQNAYLRASQDINRAVNEMVADHAAARIVYEELHVASMRFKARTMNAYLYASNLGHIPEQLAWATAKRGRAAHTVKAAYSSQECSRCHFVDRTNRANQQTFCCGVCGYRDHADHNASVNLARRYRDAELSACQKKEQIKALLLRRHEVWKQVHRLTVVEPPVQLGLRARSETSTDVG